jgi:dipeptidyl aminopeptidase/acylaminoacyl peptidase
LAASLCANAAIAAETPTLELIMADPDWIGAAPEDPYWADDGAAVYYEQKRSGEDIRDLYRLDLASGEIAQVERSAPPLDAGRERVYDPERSHVAWVDDGDVVLKRLADGAVTQVTRTVADESGPLFSADGGRLFFSATGSTSPSTSLAGA